MSALIDRMRAEGTRARERADERARATRPRSSARFLPRGLDIVAVCGGDGTVSEAASGLAGSRRAARDPSGRHVERPRASSSASRSRSPGPRSCCSDGVPRRIQFGSRRQPAFPALGGRRDRRAGHGTDEPGPQAPPRPVRHLHDGALRVSPVRVPAPGGRDRRREARGHVRRRLPCAALRGGLDHRAGRPPGAETTSTSCSSPTATGAQPLPRSSARCSAAARAHLDDGLARVSADGRSRSGPSRAIPSTSTSTATASSRRRSSAGSAARRSGSWSPPRTRTTEAQSRAGCSASTSSSRTARSSRRPRPRAERRTRGTRSRPS